MAMWGNNGNWRLREEVMRIKAQERQEALLRAANRARIVQELAEPERQRSRLSLAGVFRRLQS